MLYVGRIKQFWFWFWLVNRSPQCQTCRQYAKWNMKWALSVICKKERSCCQELITTWHSIISMRQELMATLSTRFMRTLTLMDLWHCKLLAGGHSTDYVDHITDALSDIAHTYRWSRAQTIQVWTGIFFRMMIKTIKHIGHKTSISVGRLDAAQNVYLSRPETCCFRTWTDCAMNLKGQWSWMVWADDDFSYFDWLNRLAKFKHGVLPDHVSFCGNFFCFEISELDGLCSRPSICHISQYGARFYPELNPWQDQQHVIWQMCC